MHSTSAVNFFPSLKEIASRPKRGKGQGGEMEGPTRESTLALSRLEKQKNGEGRRRGHNGHTTPSVIRETKISFPMQYFQDRPCYNSNVFFMYV